MKYLSFIALFFYLGLLLPAAELSASDSWVDLPKSNTHVTLASQVSVTHSALYFADMPGDDNVATLWHSFEFPLTLADNISLPDTIQVSDEYPLCFPARAPPC
jgi:hypothetical protein